MKQIILVAGTLLVINTATAQHLKEAEVPTSVKASFAKKYNTSKVEAWEKEGEDYEAEFHLNKVESSAVFSADGIYKELEQDIKITELPKTVTEYCSKNFSGYKISETAKITDANGKIMYEAEMTKGKEHLDAIFDSKGSFIKK